MIIDKLCDIFDKIRLPDTFQPASGADQHSLQLFDIARSVQWSVGEDGRKRKSLGRTRVLEPVLFCKLQLLQPKSALKPDALFYENIFGAGSDPITIRFRLYSSKKKPEPFISGLQHLLAHLSAELS